MVDVVYDVPLGGSTLRQVSQSQFSEGIEVLAGRMSGSPTISDQFIQSADPIGEVTSVDIGGFCSIFGVAGSLIADGSTVQIPYHKRTNGGTFAGGSTNVLVKGVTDNPVMLVPGSITAPTMGAVTAQGQAHFLAADGETQPWDVLTGQALVAQSFQAMYGLGKVYLNAVQVPEQIGFTVNFGIGLSEKKHYDGAPYPSRLYIEEFNPSIEFSQEDFNHLDTISGGLATTSLVVWIRKRKTGATYWADNEAVHIKLSFASGFTTMQQVSAQDTKNGQQGVRCLGRTLVIGNGVAIT